MGERKKMNQFEKYLGMPAIVGKSKRQIFNFIKKRVQKRLEGWKEKFLSQAGRSVLIRAVIQAIPTYLMSCFKLPKALCTEINSMVGRFWWGGRDKERKIHWVNWKKLCKPKHEGGMGFRELEAFNDALLAKQGWRLVHNTDSFIYKVLKAKYFPRNDFMASKNISYASGTWKSIIGSRWILARGLQWRVGKGEQIRIWEDNWLPRAHCTRVVTPPSRLSTDARVCDLMQAGGRGWNNALIEEVFSIGEANLIKAIPTSETGIEDTLFWPFNKDGVYSVKSGYLFVVAQAELHQPSSSSSSRARVQFSWKQLWNLKIPPKIKVFGWRPIKGVLPTCDYLQKKKVECKLICKTCNEQVDTELHCLRDCPVARQVWLLPPLGLRSDVNKSSTVREWWMEMFKSLDKEGRAWILVIAYCWGMVDGVVQIVGQEGKSMDSGDCLGVMVEQK